MEYYLSFVSGNTCRLFARCIVHSLVFVLLYLLCSQAFAYQRGSPEAQLVSAVRDNDIIKINQLLEQGVAIQTLETSNLNYLIGSNIINKDTLRLLIEKGIDVSDGSLLHSVRDLEIARVLLDAGANINALRGEVANTPLHSLTHPSGYNNPLPKDYVGIVSLLLERGADVNAMSGSGTPLHLASASKPGTAEVIELLIKHGADVNATITFDGHHGRDPNLRLQDYTPLMRAAYYFDLEKARILLEHGADALKPKNGCDAFCIFHRSKKRRLETMRLNTLALKPSIIEKSKQQMANMEALLHQYYPDVKFEDVAEPEIKTGSETADVLYKAASEKNFTDLVFAATIVIYIIATLLYTSLIAVFLKIHFIRGMFFALLLVPLELYIAYVATNNMFRGVDAAYAGGGVIVFVLGGIVVGLLVMLILVPVVLAVFCRKENQLTRS